MKNVRITRREFGDIVQAGIHRAIDAAPLVRPEVKDRIKSCGGCARRKDALNRTDRAIRNGIAYVTKPFNKS